jgi:hypothetical protein
VSIYRVAIYVGIHTIFAETLKELVAVCLHVCIMLYPYERNLFIIHEKSLPVDMSRIFAGGECLK